MKSNSLPTILLVPGAFTDSSCYDHMLPHLQLHSFPVVVASLPSSDPETPKEHTAASDGRYLLEKCLLPLINEGRDVVVFAHSFGATTLSRADKKLSKRQRSENGLSGGVLGLVYISFAMCTDGQSQLEYLGGAWPPFCKLNHPREGVLVFDPVIDMLFNDAEPEHQQQLASTHLSHSINVFETPVSSPLWTDPHPSLNFTFVHWLTGRATQAFEGRRVLIKTMLDATFPPAAQQMFANNSGVPWKIVDIEAGHEAILIKPEEVAHIILDSARQFQAE